MNCPFCGDLRKRLWVNHMFGVAYEDGDAHLYLATCFNEQDCIDSRRRQRELLERIFPFGYGRRMRRDELAEAATASEADAPAIAACARLPAPLIPLSDPLAGSACAYLVNRGFDPAELTELWQVGFCPYSSCPPPSFRNRIVIPIRTYRPTTVWSEFERVLAGWQARLIQDTDTVAPKYLTMKGMKKSQVLYGLDRARDLSRPLVIVEGVTDVWRLGSNAVAILGSSMSTLQRSLVVHHAIGRPVVFLLDRDAWAVAHALAIPLRSALRVWPNPGRVVVAELPQGRNDVGECTRQEAWGAVANALGCPVDQLGGSLAPETANQSVAPRGAEAPISREPA